ncbi:hypothetical protein RCL1_000189 [Eukaryota sp. TZLM3-RCL]
MTFSISKLSTLTNKSLDKRKSALTYLESLVSNCFNEEQLAALILELATYSNSNDFNNRRTATCCLGALSSLLQNMTDLHSLPAHLYVILMPVISRVHDTDNRVRQLAFESLLLIVKSATIQALPFTHLFFKCLVSGYADPDKEVVLSAIALDSQLRDVVVHNGSLVKLDPFLPTLKTAFRLPFLSSRLIALKWTAMFVSSVNIDVLPYLHVLVQEAVQLLTLKDEESMGKDEPLSGKVALKSNLSPKVVIDTSLQSEMNDGVNFDMMTFPDQISTSHDVAVSALRVLSQLREIVIAIIPENQSNLIEEEINRRHNSDPLSLHHSQSQVLISMINPPSLSSVNWSEFVKVVIGVLNPPKMSTSRQSIKEGLKWVPIIIDCVLNSSRDLSLSSFLLPSLPSLLSSVLKHVCYSDTFSYEPYVSDAVSSLKVVLSKSLSRLNFNEVFNSLSDLLPTRNYNFYSKDLIKFEIVLSFITVVVTEHWQSSKQFISAKILGSIIQCGIVAVKNDKSSTQLADDFVVLLSLILSKSEQLEVQIFTSIIVSEILESLLIDEFFAKPSVLTHFFDLICSCKLLNPKNLILNILESIKIKTTKHNLPPKILYKYIHFAVPVLTLILFSSSSLHSTRRELEIKTNPIILQFLQVLGCAPVSALIISIYSGSYYTAMFLIQKITEIGITEEDFLLLDRFVQLFESPFFASIRLRLSNSVHRSGLYSCLTAVSLILPQSRALDLLVKRLSAVASLFNCTGDFDASCVSPENDVECEYIRMLTNVIN